MRDAGFGRQRFWGEPIPIYYKDGIPHALDQSELPLVLPEVDKYLPTEDGEPPLARANNWKYKAQYDYEHSTMPGWAGSSWYFLRYMDSANKAEFVGKDKADNWKNVDLYIGGSEHATGHLLYVRFWTKALKDLGFIGIDEPAKKLINQGMIQGRSNFVYRFSWSLKGEVFDHKKLPPNFVSKGVLNNQELLKDNINSTLESNGIKNVTIWNPEGYKFTSMNVDVNIVQNDILDKEAFKKWRDDFKNAVFITEENGDYICGVEVEKMSKSKWNVVSPDDMCEKYGADTLRLYEMFLGPLELSKPWNTNGITGVNGFLKKLWRLFFQGGSLNISEDEATKAELKTLHKTIKKITEDIERFSFNTSVSNFMICVNELTDLKCNKRSVLEPLLVLISPYAPHITEELWSLLGHKESISTVAFPLFNEAYLIEDNFNYPISFNGKTRFNLELPATLGAAEIEKIVLENAQSQIYLEGKAPKKVIVVPKKIVNIVI